MSDVNFVDRIMAWLHTPGTSEPEGLDDYFSKKDDIWHHHELFQGETEIMNKAEWYDSPNVIGIYKDHKYVFKQNMGIGGPDETFYFQNVDSREFESVMEVSESLPSGHGSLRLETDISTKNPPDPDNNDFALIEYWVSVYVDYSLPGGIDFLPRILAYPLNRFFRGAFERFILEEIVLRDTEYARERLSEYFDIIRKHHGEEPIQTKTRQEAYTPGPEERRFFQ
ncbi:MAG: hypothetical protein ABEJ75_01245 [Candidatus Nanohaloarchaea archaeon]